MNSKSKYWCITDNQFVLHAQWIERVATLRDVIDYCSMQLEEAPETKRPHVQGFFAFKTARTFAKVKEWFPGAHLEIKSNKSSFDQAIEYTQKEESRIPYDKGGWRIEVCICYAYRPVHMLRQRSVVTAYRKRNFWYFCRHTIFKTDLENLCDGYLCVDCYVQFV